MVETFEKDGSRARLRFGAAFGAVAPDFLGEDVLVEATVLLGDEVLVGFANGDFAQPIVLGQLWDGSDPPPPNR